MTSPIATPETVGFIGLGDMGGPIAARIAASGHPLTVWARSPRSLSELGSHPHDVAPTIQALGQACSIVGLCVFGDADVEQVAGGADGLLASMRPAAILLVHSTVSPELCTDLAERGAARGVHVLDAPVTGARSGALAGTLTIMVGGDESLSDRVTPLLQCYGDIIRWMGPVGSGQKMKTLNNVLAFANGRLASMAIDVGTDLGLNTAAVADVLASGSGSSFGLRSLLNDILPHPEFAAHAATMIAKDTALFRDVLNRGGLPPSLIERLASEQLENPRPRML